MSRSFGLVVRHARRRLVVVVVAPPGNGGDQLIEGAACFTERIRERGVWLLELPVLNHNLPGPRVLT
jgi:hypothetical protein